MNIRMDEYEELRINTSSLGKIILKLNQMCKKPSIDSDLNEALDVFVKSIGESELFLENGIFSLNFSEAALFIQSATDLFGKKVDLLWDHILDYQKRIILYDKKEHDNEINKLEERINRYKRRKTKIDLNSTKKTSVDVLFKKGKDFPNPNQSSNSRSNVNNRNITFNMDREGINDRWDCRYSDTPLRYTGESDKYRPKRDTCHIMDNFPIYDLTEDPATAEPVMYYKQWHGLSIMEFLFQLYEEGELDDIPEAITKLRIDLDLIHKYRLEHDIPSHVPRHTFEKDLQKYVQSYLQAQRRRLPPEMEETRKKLCPSQTVINIERLPLQMVNDKLRRVSLLDPPKLVAEKENGEQFSDKDREIDKNPNPDPTVTMEKMPKQISPDNKHDSGFCDNEDIDNEVVEIVQELEIVVIDPVPETDPLDQSDAVQNIEPIGNNDSTQIDDGSLTQIDDRSLTRCIVKVQKNERNASKQNINVEDLKKVKSPAPKRQNCDVLDTPSKRRKLTPKQIEKLSKPIAKARLSTFEKFYFENYNPGENEGELVFFSDYEDSSVDEDEFLGFSNSDVANQNSTVEDDDDNGSQTDISQESRINCDSEIDTTLVNTSSTTNNLDSANSLEQATDKQLSFIPIPAGESDTTNPVPETSVKTTNKKSHMYGPTEEEMEQCRSNVYKWRKYIEPKLKNLSGNEFDIHAYGSEIMDSMKINEEKHFSEIVSGKSSAEVVRFFISSLQLANTNNIEIGGAEHGQIANDTFSIKLLTKERYHEHLSTFEAPSEETFRERLRRMQTVNPHIMSTPKKRRKIAQN